MFQFCPSHALAHLLLRAALAVAVGAATPASHGQTNPDPNAGVKAAVPTPLEVDLTVTPGQSSDHNFVDLQLMQRWLKGNAQLWQFLNPTTNQPALSRAEFDDLLVKRGRLLFAGRPDAPQLDILAVRALTEPQVGVQVQGPLSAPKVELYANVAMPDSEKLSWLLLGHPSARGGSEAALIQNAVLALVGDTNALLGGVDEFSIEGETKLSDGSTRAAQLTVGKQLGERLYTSYTRSVSSVQGLLSVYLKLTNSLAVRAQTGEANNVDLVWSRAYD